MMERTEKIGIDVLYRWTLAVRALKCFRAGDGLLRPWFGLIFFYCFFPIAGSFTNVGKKY